ncbi:hypothetical protein [Burkholderia sp. Bp9140]|uniref:hypothetical protein n=1 Tax=Burkholderia sp. Bp9140 TaxID=2184572 RepID=UPI0021AB6726|nr:hypothetical protein [Burkholderia sp. Bp9140]
MLHDALVDAFAKDVKALACDLAQRGRGSAWADLVVVLRPVHDRLGVEEHIGEAQGFSVQVHGRANASLLEFDAGRSPRTPAGIVATRPVSTIISRNKTSSERVGQRLPLAASPASVASRMAAVDRKENEINIRNAGHAE